MDEASDFASYTLVCIAIGLVFGMLIGDCIGADVAQTQSCEWACHKSQSTVMHVEGEATPLCVCSDGRVYKRNRTAMWQPVKGGRDGE